MSTKKDKKIPADVADNTNVPNVEIKDDKPSKYEAEIIIGGKARTIKKLKAGEFYKAQRAFAGILGSVTKGLDTKKIAKDKIDPNNPEQLKEIASDADISEVMNVLAEAPAKMAGFVAICAGMDEKELLNEAYPEEIPEAFNVCYDLNNMAENIKNFGAPMRMLGAGLE